MKRLFKFFLLLFLTAFLLIIVWLFLSKLNFKKFNLEGWVVLRPLETAFLLKDKLFFQQKSEEPQNFKEIIWCGKECFWLGKNGILFEPAPFSEGFIIPVIIEESERALLLNEEAFNKAQTKAIYDIVSFLNQLELSFDNIKINNFISEEVAVYLKDGPIIYFSLRFSPDFAVSTVKSLKDSANWQKIQYINLTVENRAYYSEL